MQLAGVGAERIRDQEVGANVRPCRFQDQTLDHR